MWMDVVVISYCGVAELYRSSWPCSLFLSRTLWVEEAVDGLYGCVLMTFMLQRWRHGQYSVICYAINGNICPFVDTRLCTCFITKILEMTNSKT